MVVNNNSSFLAHTHTSSYYKVKLFVDLHINVYSDKYFSNTYVVAVNTIYLKFIHLENK